MNGTPLADDSDTARTLPAVLPFTRRRTLLAAAKSRFNRLIADGSSTDVDTPSKRPDIRLLAIP